MSYGIKLECWGDYACFTRPEMKVERVSYEMMTPSAARGILDAIYWHPGLHYVIDEIDLLAPIKFTNVRRNEVTQKLLAGECLANGKAGKEIELYPKACIVQRASMILKDVRYCIHAHFLMTDKATATDNPGKFLAIFTRRAKKGQCYHQPYLGTREFEANFRLVEDNEIITPEPVTRDLGYMLYDMDYADGSPARVMPQPEFFYGRLVNGVMDLRDVEVHK